MTQPVPSNPTPGNPPSALARWWGHAWLDARSVQRRLPPEALKRLEAAVRDSESRHRGELRLCIEGGLGPMWPGRPVSTRARAIELFSLLRVWDTAQNNGVLIRTWSALKKLHAEDDRVSGATFANAAGSASCSRSCSVCAS